MHPHQREKGDKNMKKKAFRYTVFVDSANYTVSVAKFRTRREAEIFVEAMKREQPQHNLILDDFYEERTLSEIIKDESFADY